MGKLDKRLERLEQTMKAETDPDRITVIEVFGDRGNGEELLETYELKNDRWVKAG